MRSARDARELVVELDVDMSLLEVVPELVVLGDVVALLLVLGDVVVVLGDVLVLLDVEVDGLVEVDVDGLVEVVLGDVLVPLLLMFELGDVPVPEVVLPVAPVPDVPAAVPELLERVSDAPAAFEPCGDAAPVELGSLPVPEVAPVLCAYDTPMTAVNDAIAAMVKLFGNLLMWRSPVAE